MNSLIDVVNAQLGRFLQLVTFDTIYEQASWKLRDDTSDIKFHYDRTLAPGKRLRVEQPGKLLEHARADKIYVQLVTLERTLRMEEQLTILHRGVVRLEGEYVTMRDTLSKLILDNEKHLRLGFRLDDIERREDLLGRHGTDVEPTPAELLASGSRNDSDISAFAAPTAHTTSPAPVWHTPAILGRPEISALSLALVTSRLERIEARDGGADGLGMRLVQFESRVEHELKTLHTAVETLEQKTDDIKAVNDFVYDEADAIKAAEKASMEEAELEVCDLDAM